MNNNETIKYQKEIEKSKKRRKKLLKVGMLLISLIVIVGVMTSIYMIKNYYVKLNKVEYDNYEVYQYFAGKKIEYTGKVTIEKKNEIVSIKNKDEDMEIDNIPIYFQKIANQVMFPVNMSIVYLNNKTQAFKINYFSILESDVVNEEESAFVKYQDKKGFLNDSIIYDGNDLYVFPYSVRVVVDDEEFNLSPLSYVIVDNNSSVEIYNKNADEYKIIDDFNNNVLAYYKKYKINLSTDMVMYEKDNRILRKNVNKLDLFEFK